MADNDVLKRIWKGNQLFPCIFVEFPVPLTVQLNTFYQVNPSFACGKNKILCFPHRIGEEADIKPDDMLEITYMNGVVPADRKGNKRSVMEYAGIAKGIWGKTTSTITKMTSLKYSLSRR